MGLGFFRSEADQLAAVQAKLAVAVEEEARAEQGLKDAALAAALSPDPFAAEPQREALRRAREKVELLQAALVAAEDANQQALAKAKADLRKSQNRAIRQRIGALLKEARRFDEAEAARVSAFAAMIDTAEKIRPLIPQDREYEFFSGALTPRRLSGECQEEMNRQSANHFGKYSELRMPGADYPMIGFQPGEMLPIAERLKVKLLGAFEHLVGTAPPPVPVAEPEPRRKPARLPPPSPTVTEQTPPSSATPAVVEPSAAEPVAIDLDRIHPTDPAAKAGFELELAIMRGEIDLAPVADPIEVEPVETIDADPVEVAAVEVETIEPDPAAVDPIEVGDAEPIQAAPIEPAPALQASLGQILSRR